MPHAPACTDAGPPCAPGSLKAKHRAPLGPCKYLSEDVRARALRRNAQAYWPFHKAFCRRNDFADCLEAADPRFAAWLRRHGKQAVLGDGERFGSSLNGAGGR